MIETIDQEINPVTALPGLLSENRPAAVNLLVEVELPRLADELETARVEINSAIEGINLATTNIDTKNENVDIKSAKVDEQYLSFDDRYLGGKATAPTLGNRGQALQSGMTYYNTTTMQDYRYNGISWALLDTSNIYTKAEIDNKVFEFKNDIIDGNFDFWHEATTQTTSGYGSDTMWLNKNVGTTKTHSRQSFAVGEVFSNGKKTSQYYSRTIVNSVAGVNNYCSKSHRIENVARLAGTTRTIQIRGKADATKNIAISLVQNFGTGGSPSANVYVPCQIVALTSSFGFYTITFNVPSILGKTIGTDGLSTSYTELIFWFDAGSTVASTYGLTSFGQQSGTFDIAMVQQEEGLTASKLEELPPELIEFRIKKSLRYEQINWQGYGLESNQIITGIPLSPIMRAIPAISLSNIVTANSNSISASAIPGYTQLVATITTSGMAFVSATIKLDARL